VGDLDDYEGEEQSIVPREDGSLLVDAWIDTHELLLRLGIDEQPQDNDSDYHFVGGVVFAERGKLPRVGAKVEWRGLTLEIVDMDGNRIDRILVSRIPPAKDATTSHLGSINRGTLILARVLLFRRSRKR
jgi:putative hemolysin